jgi:hypothetical protein
MSASGGKMWTLGLIIFGCFLPITLSDEAKEAPSIGKQYIY